MHREKIENILKEHEDNKKCKTILEIELDCIEKTGISAVNYSSERVSETNKINRPTEKTALKNITKEPENNERREDIRIQIKVLESRIKIIEFALARLREDERKVIEKYYFEDKSYDTIKREIYLTYKQIRNRRSTALNKIKKTFEMLEERKRIVS